MIKPLKTLLLLFYIGCITTVIMVLSPGELPLGQNLSMKVFTLPTLEKQEDTVKETDMTDYLALQAKLDSIALVKEKQQARYQDSLDKATPLASSSGNKEMVAQKEKKMRILVL